MEVPNPYFFLIPLFRFFFLNTKTILYWGTAKNNSTENSAQWYVAVCTEEEFGRERTDTYMCE